MHKTIAKAAKILFTLLIMTLSPFVIVVIWGTIYVTVKAFNGSTLTAGIKSFKAVLAALVPYFPYLTIIPAALFLLIFIIKGYKRRLPGKSN